MTTPNTPTIIVINDVPLQSTPGNNLLIVDTSPSIVVFLGAQGPPGSDVAEGGALFVSGRPGNGEQVMRYIWTRAASLSATLSLAAAGVAPASNSVFTITRDPGGHPVGTLTFLSSVTAGVWSVSSSTFAAGELLVITAPSPQDANLADVAISFLGT